MRFWPSAVISGTKTAAKGVPVKRGTFGIFLVVLGAARLYYENGMAASSPTGTQSVLQGLDFAGSGGGGGTSLSTVLILGGGLYALLAKPGMLTGRA